MPLPLWRMRSSGDKPLLHGSLGQAGKTETHPGISMMQENKSLLEQDEISQAGEQERVSGMSDQDELSRDDET